ncbi:MAG: hypothetical protein A3K19_29005 [Lentisphaerae bacterium RIFOXYB12_FULL_65_16]|nr:MAG: hypothetical protein A3K18_25590 [Lentisphaerae bacterium RIFOXYA12_64_32]OGV88331.1 MAG: hypothetical protein A3K19_29005 [Lentisphaerae bacterium RIFOXYB12_FULL_65_16]
MGAMIKRWGLCLTMAACSLLNTPAYAAPQLNGFAEWRGGLRLGGDAHQSNDATLDEARLQLDSSASWKNVQFRGKADFMYDAVDSEADIDPREVSAAISPLSAVDLKLGRQTLTWGVGDYLFINDLFPKDWKSFLLGRDDEYLKAPSDAVKASFFSDIANLDVVYTPRFNPDRYIDGKRVSFFNPRLNRLAGAGDAFAVEKRDDWFTDDEVAARISRNIGGFDAALYGYHGFWKSPMGFDAISEKATFPPLGVYGASVRGNVVRGVGSLETGYYDSPEDRSGDDPLVPNSQARVLVGYEQEIVTDFTVGGQYYLEHMMSFGAYRASLPNGTALADEDRHVLTSRLTWLALHQSLRLSLFTFYSPSDNDAYLRPTADYRIDDHWAASIGANLFMGESERTFFGQFEDAANVFASLRYGF